MLKSIKNGALVDIVLSSLQREYLLAFDNLRATLCLCNGLEINHLLLWHLSLTIRRRVHTWHTKVRRRDIWEAPSNIITLHLLRKHRHWILLRWWQILLRQGLNLRLNSPQR